MLISVVPQPQKVNIKTGNFNNSTSLKVYFEDNSELEKCVTKLSELKDKKKLNVNKVKVSGDANLILSIEDNYLKKIPGCTVPDESYALIIDKDKIRINASTAKGIFYGVITLIQLFENQDNIPVCEIYDYPDIKVRGISDDFSRGQVSTLKNFKRIIDFIARYKMNTYMPYMEDVLEISAYPEIGKDRGALSREEVAEIHKYAEANFVEVVPVYQTLGHYENILAIEKFLEYAEFPGAASLNVSNPDTYVFLENMLKEVFEMFPSKYFHMGADESWDVGLGESKELVEKSSIAEVHAEHYKKVHAICKKYGKTVLMYGDVILNHPEILDMLPKDIIIVDWHYGANNYYPSTKTFKDAGHEYYVSPAVWNFLTTFPTNLVAVPNIKYIVDSGLKNGTTGMINSNWGDYGAETFKEQILYGYAWSAQCAWSYEKSCEGTFDHLFFKDFFGIENTEGASIYNLLAVAQNTHMWHEIWRHPLLDFRSPVWWEPNTYFHKVAKITYMRKSAETMKQQIAALEGKATQNKDHLDFLKYQLDFNHWYAKKIETQFELHSILKGEKADTDMVLAMIDENIELLSKLKLQYVKLWKRYYKSANLHMVEDKFDRLISYFGETREEVNAGKVESPEIKSKWIYYPAEDDKLIRHAVFKKEFEIDGDVNSATMQMLGNTHCKLLINGKQVARVFARRSLSLLVDYKRIAMVDIKEYLKPGKNTIEVYADNFNKKGSAGVNIYGEISADKDIVILSDSSWLSNITGLSREWKNAKEGKFRNIVIKPNFAKGRSSWIER